MTDTTYFQRSLQPFLSQYPGPFRISPSTDGVDSTFNINCETTGQFVIATRYWDEREWAKLVAIGIADALNLAREAAT